MLVRIVTDYIPFQQFRFMLSCKARQFINKVHSLLLGDEIRRLHRIDEDAKFGYVELPVRHIKVVAFSFIRHHLETPIVERPDVRQQRLVFDVNAARVQTLYQLVRR